MATNNGISYLVFSVLAIFYVYYLLFYPYAFNYQTDINDYYVIKFVLAVVILIYIILHRLILNSNKFGTEFFLFFGFYFLISNYNKGNEYSIILFSIIAIGAILYLGKVVFPRVLLGIILGALLLEIVLIIRQTLISSSIYHLTGTFNNTGITAIYLTVHIPILEYFFLYRKNIIEIQNRNVQTERRRYELKNDRKYSILIFYAYLVLVLTYILVVRSRISIVAFVVCAIIFIFNVQSQQLKKKWSLLSKKNKIFIIILGVSAISIFTIWLLNIKRGSLYGHLLLFKIAVKNLAENFWFGAGIGHFTSQYPRWQANFFSSSAYSTTDWLSASESYLVFNEYIQLFETIGILGFASFSSILFIFFSLKSQSNTKLIIALKTTVLAILICGLSSYPFHVNVLLLLLIICIIIAFSFKENSFSTLGLPRYILGKHTRFYKVCLIILYASSVHHLIVSGVQLYSFYKWKMVSGNALAIDETGKDRLRKIYPILKNDWKFLIAYGTYLAKDSSSYVDAINVLEESKKYHISKKSITTLAETYTALKDYSNAKKNWKWLSEFIPNLFLPKFELLKLYILTKDSSSAEKLYFEIVNMPVKVPSYEVLEIKNKSKELMKYLYVD